jgi:hypothetical protein
MFCCGQKVKIAKSKTEALENTFKRMSLMLLAAKKIPKLQSYKLSEPLAKSKYCRKQKAKPRGWKLFSQMRRQVTDPRSSKESLMLDPRSTSCICIPLNFRCSKHNSPNKSSSHGHKDHVHVPRYRTRTASEQEEIRKQTASILQKALAVLQLTALAQFGCGSEHFHKNSLKKTTKGNHYG